MEDSHDMRNMLLSELIDKMHSRMADKMFPPDPSVADQPAATGIDREGQTAEGFAIPRELPSMASVDEKSIDKDNDATHLDADEPDDEELEEMLKGG